MMKRIETDSMGEIEVPSDRYYGAQTARSLIHFDIGAETMPREIIRGMGILKKASAIVNSELGLLPEDKKDLIIKSADEVIAGTLDDHFPLRVWQTGSGTQSNMNTNEVIANRAIEISGGQLGSKEPIHPNDHVNIGQSSNDVIPTSIHLAALDGIHNRLIPALQHMHDQISLKATEFLPVVKTGRTHLQDATPVRLGQEFEGYAGQIERGIDRLRASLDRISEVALGGTAVGTGVNTHPEFAKLVCDKLTEINGFMVRETTNHFQAQSSLDAIVECSGALKTIAVSLMKIANDIRWLGSGPRAGIGEIELPAVQPGSSIMPGKVNPVIPESVCQVAAQVIGNDTTITIAGQSGNFEINVMMPIAAHNLLESIDIATTATRNLADQCISGINPTTTGPDMVQNGLAIVTTLVPHIGYDASSAIAKEAGETGESVKEVALRQTSLSETELDEILDASSMTEPGLGGVSIG